MWPPRILWAATKGDGPGGHPGQPWHVTPACCLATSCPAASCPGSHLALLKAYAPRPPPITSTARLDPELHPPLAPDRATACVTFGSCARAQKSVSTDQVACEGTLVPGFARPDCSKRSRRNGFASPSDSTPSHNHAVLQKGSRGRTRLPHPALRREALTPPLSHLSTVKKNHVSYLRAHLIRTGAKGC